MYVQNGKLNYLDLSQSNYNGVSDQGGTLSNYHKELSYEVPVQPKFILDTCYICLFINFQNSVGETQKPFKIFYRKSNKTGEKLIPVISGKEYSEVLYFMSDNQNGSN